MTASTTPLRLSPGGRLEEGVALGRGDVRLGVLGLLVLDVRSPFRRASATLWSSSLGS